MMKMSACPLINDSSTHHPHPKTEHPHGMPLTTNTPKPLTYTRFFILVTLHLPLHITTRQPLHPTPLTHELPLPRRFSKHSHINTHTSPTSQPNYLSLICPVFCPLSWWPASGVIPDGPPTTRSSLRSSTQCGFDFLINVLSH